MRNYDETILRRRQIDPQAPFPPLHQALRIALYDEYAARAFHARVLEAFGRQAPFTAAVKTGARHVATLSGLCERYGVPRPLDPFPTETSLAPSWRANCARAAAGEQGKAGLYATLAPQVAAADVRKAFRRLQAAALDQALPAFRHAAHDASLREHYHAARGIAASEAYARHGPVSDFLERTLTLLGHRHGALGFIGPLLKSANPVMLAGIASGAAAVFLTREKSRPSPMEN